MALVGELGLQTPTARLPNSIAGIFSTDHIAVPEGWEVQDARRLIAESGGRRLTDNDAYVVETELEVPAPT
jgi:Mg/Co/Ni transporter MgtE